MFFTLIDGYVYYTRGDLFVKLGYCDGIKNVLYYLDSEDCMVIFTLVFTDYRVEIAHKAFCVDDTISVIRGKDNKFLVKDEQSVEKIQEAINDVGFEQADILTEYRYMDLDEVELSFSDLYDLVKEIINDKKVVYSLLDIALFNNYAPHTHKYDPEIGKLFRVLGNIDELQRYFEYYRSEKYDVMGEKDMENDIASLIRIWNSIND